MGLKKDIKIDHDKCVTTLIKPKIIFLKILKTLSSRNPFL
jgi:hypothetical protein